MEEINLLQNRAKVSSSAWQNQSRIIISILVVILVALVGAWVVFYLLTSSVDKELATAQTEGQHLKSQLDDKEKGLDDAKTFQAQLQNLKVLLGSHIYLTPLLDELSSMTYVKTQYSSLVADSKGTIALQGIVPSYNELGKLLLGLSTSNKFNNVKLLSVGPSTGKINAYQFLINLNIDPSYFNKK